MALAARLRALGPQLTIWGAAALLVGVTAALWVRFGPAVFLEMVASAWRFCF